MTLEDWTPCIASTLLALLCTACGDAAGHASFDPVVTAPPAEELPDIVLVTFDTLRADHCSTYGYERETTPVMTAVGEGGVVVETAYAVTATTGPAHATLFTSLYPDEHGVLTNAWQLVDDFATFAEVMRASGYTTAAFTSSFPVNRRFGFAQGFDHFDDDFSDATPKTTSREFLNTYLRVEGNFDRPADETTQKAIAWLETQDGPVFLWVHYFDPHAPYRAHKNMIEEMIGLEEARKLRSSGGDMSLLQYDAEIRFADREAGRLLAAVEGRESPAGVLTILVADHGEGLGDHGWGAHGVNVYDELVRVPLVLRWPDTLPEGRRLSGPAALVDLLPSVTSLIGIEVAGMRVRGADLSSAWTGDEPGDPERAVFLRRRFYAADDERQGKKIDTRGTEYGVRKGKWKLIVAEAEDSIELYDLEADPGELTNLAEREPGVRDQLEKVLARWEQSLVVFESPTYVGGVSAEVEGIMEGLGYVDLDATGED